jgi:hypothetical protein
MILQHRFGTLAVEFVSFEPGQPLTEKFPEPKTDKKRQKHKKLLEESLAVRIHLNHVD